MAGQIENIFIKRFGYFNCYVIKGKDGDILIDTGFLCMQKRLKKWLDKFNVKLIILTHSHIDHVWNVAYLKEQYNCEIAIGQKDVKFLDNSKIHSEPVNKYYKIVSMITNLGMKKLLKKNLMLI